MDFKKLFYRNNKKGNIEKIESENLDIPTVIFKDLVLQVTIGQWLNLLSSQKCTSIPGLSVYSHLKAEELLKKVVIPEEKLDEIAKKFGLVLKLIGINSSETCTLSQFDKDIFLFNCHFENSNEDAEIFLSWECFPEACAELNIKYKNVNKTYLYIEEYKNHPISLELERYTITNNNGNQYQRYLLNFKTFIHISNENYNFYIDISEPKSQRKDSIKRAPFILKNEEQLEQYLLGLSFPIAIDDVYKK